MSAPNSTPATADPSAPPEPEPGFVTMLVSAFHAPDVVGASAARRGADLRVLLALLLIVAIVSACAWITMPQAIETAMEQIRSNPDIQGEARVQAEQFMGGTFGKVMIFAQWFIFGVLGIPVIALALFLGQMMMGGRARFGAVFAVATFASVISSGLGSVVRSALVLAKNSFTEVSTGLGVLALDRPITDPVRIGLDAFDFFVIWATWSAGVALVAPAKLKKGTTLGISFAIYVLFFGAMTALRLLGAAAGG